MDNPVRLHWLDPRDPDQPFPPQHKAMRDPNGLLAIGGDLSVQRLIRAYSAGVFPWYNPNEPILWWCPDPRAVLAPGAFHVSHSLAKAIRRDDYAVTLDADFAAVLDGCSGSRRGGSQGTWLGPDMKRAYLELHARGHAHSVEIWRGGALIGGLYGVAVGGAYFGESMFSRATDASKLALYWLCRQLQAWGFGMIDCQIASSHLKTLGAVDISRERFLLQLAPLVAQGEFGGGLKGGLAGRWRFELGEAPCDHRHAPPAVTGVSAETLPP